MLHREQLQRVIALVKATLSWRGRACRRTFYTSIGLWYLGGLIVSPVGIFVLLAPKGTRWTTAAGVLSTVLGIAFAVFLLGAVVRRLHDRGKSGWWLVVFFGPHAALVSALSQIPESEQELIGRAFLAAAIVAGPPFAWGFIEIFLAPSRRGANRYGLAPEAAI